MDTFLTFENNTVTKSGRSLYMQLLQRLEHYVYDTVYDICVNVCSQPITNPDTLHYHYSSYAISPFCE